MNVLINPEFKTKIESLSQDAIQSISTFLKSLTGLTKDEILVSIHFHISLLGDGVYAAKINSSRLYFTFGENEKDEYLLLLDYVEVNQEPSSEKHYFSANNPKVNSSLNPKTNTSINPKYNTSINPKYNTSINPKYNTSINPKYNSSINPKYNSSINPKYNTSLNPKYNYGYGGPFIYDLELNQIGYIVKAGDLIDIVFSINGQQTGFIIDANDQVMIEFDMESNWVGYYVKANDQVYLKYSLEDQFISTLIV